MELPTVRQLNKAWKDKTPYYFTRGSEFGEISDRIDGAKTEKGLLYLSLFPYKGWFYPTGLAPFTITSHTSLKHASQQPNPAPGTSPS